MNIKGKKLNKIFILAILLMGLKVTFIQSQDPVIALTESTCTKETWVTVFVHGIMSIKPHVSFNNFVYFVKDQVEDTLYAKTVELMRKDQFFHQNQAMQGFGLEKSEPNNISKGNSSGALAFLFNEMEAHGGLSRDNHYYTFGWSGLLSQKKRYKDAKILFTELENLIAEYHANNIFPKLRLIGYSHGGNVLLNLAAIHQRELPNARFSVNELILIGMPVLPETDYYINDSLFKKIYHFYSKHDRVQKLDLFSSKHLFSNRTFKGRKGFILPDKLTQIQLKVSRSTNGNKNNPHKRQLACNYTNPSIITGRSHLLRDISPGHAELWFFGWTPLHYRKSYPLYPLPTISYIPLIIQNTENIRNNMHACHSIVADLRPEFNVMVMRRKYDTKTHKIVLLPPAEKLEKLVTTTLQYAPGEYTSTLYDEHVKIAHQKAIKTYETQQRSNACNSNRPDSRRRCKKIK